MNSTMLQDAAVPVVDAVRDASKAVGSMIQGPVQKLNLPQVPAHLPAVHLPSVHLPAVHLPQVHLRRKRRRRGLRNLALLGGLGLVVVVIARLRKRKAEPLD